MKHIFVMYGSPATGKTQLTKLLRKDESILVIDNYIDNTVDMYNTLYVIQTYEASNIIIVTNTRPDNLIFEISILDDTKLSVIEFTAN